MIGLLSTFAIITLNSLRVKARNATRIAAVVQLAKAFGLASDAAGGVLPENESGACVAAECYGWWSGYGTDSTVDAFIAPYIKKPADPRDSGRPFGGYYYITESGQGRIGYALETVEITDSVCGPGFWLGNDPALGYILCRIALSF